MRKLTISLIAGAVVLTASGVALAQGLQSPAPDLTRAAAQQRATEAFARMDANGDGRIDATDRDARQKARFDRIDADKNGALSLAEFTAARSDRDGDRAGRGDRGPRRHMRGGLAGPPMGPNGIIDANQDGTLTQAEFTAAALARFDAADADSNGTVTAAERKAQRDTMREHGANAAAITASADRFAEGRRSGEFRAGARSRIEGAPGSATARSALGGSLFIYESSVGMQEFVEEISLLY